MAPSSRGDLNHPSASATEGDGNNRVDAPVELTFSFGPFRLFPRRQLLLKRDTPVPLGSRAFELLHALVEHAGEIVDKDSLMTRAWSDVTVDESNLRAQITGLRRVLADGGTGENYVVTLPGRGYRFVAVVARSTGEAEIKETDKARTPLDRPTRLIGRADIIAMVGNRLQRSRFVTITGPAGIGKTSVALAVADKLLPSYRGGARFVDLAPLKDPGLVPSALASVLGVAVRSENPYPALISFLKDKQTLIVLDNCEHVLMAAAGLAEELLKAVPGVHVLATSREPLRAQDERVQRLPPLETAPVAAALTAAEAYTYPAVQLFVERATANAGGYEFKDEDVQFVAQICRRLDGIALAIELAAGRVDAFGVRGVARRLDDRFQLLTRGRRTALPRHQTLGAAFDWSYELLSETERAIMRRLGIFAGRFTMDAAIAVAGSADIAPAVVDETVADLVEKSLVVADVGDAAVFYRLTDTARAYALKKLSENGEAQAFARQHASHFREQFERAQSDWATWPTAEWLATYAAKLDDLRSALDWAFSPSGDAEAGIALTVAAEPLWFEMSLMEECRTCAERALTTLEKSGISDERRRMLLYAAVAWSQMYTAGSGRDTGAAWATTAGIAEALNDTDYRLRALWGLWATQINRGKFGAARTMAKRFSELAETVADKNDRLIGDRLTGVALHFLGDQPAARLHLERMLAGYVAPVQRSHAARFQFHQQVSARMTLARVLWLQGFPEQALSCVETNIEHALAIDHTLSLCNALANAACPIALVTGDLEAAEYYIKMLLRQTEREAFDIWHAFGRCFEGELDVKRGHLPPGLERLRAGVEELRRAGFGQYLTTFLGRLAVGLAAAGDAPQALATIDEAIKRNGQSEERWCTPELLRIKGAVVLQQEGDNAAAVAERDFLESVHLARTQEALAWELRTATSLARLWLDQGRTSEAYELISPVFGRFREGHQTDDLRAANTLLGDLARHR
ncbi:winged helix-turn-helix domain-containing protein [Bradyrhizobium sp. UFLA05-109]